MYWLAGILGMAAVLLPFVFNYAENMLALWTSIIVGIVLLSIAGTKLFYGNDHITRVRQIR